MPDALKIYPCMVMPGTPLYEQYKKGKFIPMTTEEAAQLLIKIQTIFTRDNGGKKNIK